MNVKQKTHIPAVTGYAFLLYKSLFHQLFLISQHPKQNLVACLNK